MNEQDYIDELQDIIAKFREQHKAEGFSYFICATNREHTNAFSSVDASGQELMGLLAAAMRQNKNVEDCILWIAEHYKQLNIIMQNGIQRN